MRCQRCHLLMLMTIVFITDLLWNYLLILHLFKNFKPKKSFFDQLIIINIEFKKILQFRIFIILSFFYTFYGVIIIQVFYFGFPCGETNTNNIDDRTLVIVVVL